jgi:hypothetical protein
MAARGGAMYSVPFIKVYDRVHDIAILKIDGAATFDAAPLGDSDKVEPRDAVLAVGNPRDIGINITEGSVSQIHRSQQTKKPRFLVHTAQITNGNSGGSLYKGSRVVGVNVSGLVDPTTGSQTGFNFAVPINFVRELLDNPDYDRTDLLTDVFSPDLAVVQSKMKQVGATTQTVPPGNEESRGVWSTRMSFDKLTDYVIILQTYDDVDLDLAVMHRGTNIGYSNSTKLGSDVLAITNDHGRDVEIGVLNYRHQPTNFGIKIYKIVW